MDLVDVNNVRELWINRFSRAIILPLTSGIILVSIDVYVRKWFFPITDEIEVNGEKLVYYKPKTPDEVGLGKFSKTITGIELIGHIVGDLSETISARIWLKNVRKVDDVVKEIYKELTAFLKKKFEESLSGED